MGRGDRDVARQRLRDLLAAGPPERGGVRVQVDVDPQSFL